MSRRSCRNTLQEMDENIASSPSCLRKRKAEQHDVKTQAAKNQSYEIQNWWENDDASSCVLVQTPQKKRLERSDVSGFKRFRFRNLFVKPSPLPCLSWASADDVWIKMLNKELKYIHDKTYLHQHPSLQPKMRAILFEWLLQVSEVYTLHRETFYLAQDFFDRFMLTQVAIGKDQLQLIGITALFIAAKLEEIYPPKLQEFAYVTDGACDEDEILEMELIMLKALNWHLCPETPISWLKLYAQVASLKEEPNFLVSQFSQETYIQITQLLDLCTLDINSLEYQYGVLAAAAFCHFTSIETVQRVSGLTWDSISSCVRWMAPFVRTVNAYDPPKLKTFKKVAAEDSHNIQTHVDYLAMLNEAQQRQQETLDRLSPVCVGGLLTPPKSTEKPSNVGKTPETGTAVYTHHLAVHTITPSLSAQRTCEPCVGAEKSATG